MYSICFRFTVDFSNLTKIFKSHSRIDFDGIDNTRKQPPHSLATSKSNAKDLQKIGGSSSRGSHSSL